ncbi:MAG: SurA N-terminal domain-containing protein [Candidatus Omnitrophica bacterium]|nr:SurA N-terminal domain-containing protein [Candidatus Omnitrophota bacterium]
MLKFFRYHTKVIVWVAAISFILCGGYSITTLKKEGRFAGEVFGKTVTFQEYNRFYRATQLFMPSEKPIEDPDLLRNYTWQNIIYAKESKREGVKVNDQDVRAEISSILKQQGLIHLWMHR